LRHRVEYLFRLSIRGASIAHEKQSDKDRLKDRQKGEDTMSLDLRIPMGLMFTFTGLILTVFGIRTNGDAELYAKSLGINANLWWGLVLLVFGVTMFLLGRRGQAKLAKEPPQLEDGAPRRGH
jgi:hypothetical protein